MPKVALTAEQEESVRGWIRAGATIESAHERAERLGWSCSRSQVGVLAKEARRAAAPPPAAPQDAPAPTGDLVEVLERLKRLEQRLDALQQLPSETLKQAAVGAVVTARRLSQDPGVDPRVQVMALDKLPKLIELAMRIESEMVEGAGALYTPEADDQQQPPEPEASAA